MKPKKLRCIVFGTGSIGKRLIKNLRAILGDKIDIIAYKTSDRDSKILENELGVRLFYDLDEAFAEKPDFAIIANPTSMHVEYAIKAAEHGCDLFMEKPVSDRMKGIEKLENIVKKKKLITFVAYCLRFSEPFMEIKKILDSKKFGKVISAEVHVGANLAERHKDWDYRQSYSARRELGGGVLLDLSHEIDYARWFFGELELKEASVSKESDFEMDVEDTADLKTVAEKGGAEIDIHIDWIESPARRYCRIMCEKGEISWDKDSNKVIVKPNTGRKQEIDNSDEDYDDKFKNELCHFIDCVKKRKQTMIPLEDGIKTLQLVINAKKMAGWK
jgi:predicted dehydrogenase